MSDKPDNKAFVVDPRTGQSKVYDFDNPDTQMLHQFAEVLLNRLGNPAILRMLYLDTPQAMVQPEVRQIVQDLVDGKISQEQAKEQVLAWKANLPRT